MLRNSAVAVSAVLAALSLSLASPAWAQEPRVPAPPPPDERGTLTLSVENDSLANSDRYYSNGLQLVWRSPSADLPAPLAWLNERLDFMLGPGALRWGLGLGHNIFTPDNTSLRMPDPRDRPYAGYLYGAAALLRDSGDSLSVLELQLGVVGPSALGEQVQNNFHRLLNTETYAGWRYQLKDEPVGALVTQRIWRMPLGSFSGVEAEALPSASLSLGTVQTYAGLGGVVRVGQNLASDYGPPRIRPALAGSAFFQPPAEFGWYVFAGVEGRAVARDIFLDGNTWRDSPSVDKRPLVGDFQVGLAVQWRGIRLAYTQVWRSEEFYGQRGNTQFGSVGVSFRF